MILGLLIVHHSILVPPCRIVNSEAFDFCLKELATLKTWVHFQAFAIQFKESVHSVFAFLCVVWVLRSNSHAAVCHVICKTVSFLEKQHVFCSLLVAEK